jgi:hypothetical protein
MRHFAIRKLIERVGKQINNTFLNQTLSEISAKYISIFSWMILVFIMLTHNG